MLDAINQDLSIWQH